MATTPLGEGVHAPPATPGPPPEPTCEQAGRFFALLVDLGYADALDRLHAERQPAVVGDRPQSLAEAAGLTQDTEVEEPVVRFDLGGMFREIGHHDAYPRLASIIWGVPEEEAAGYPVGAVRDALYPFFVACKGPLSVLTDFVLDWA